MFDTHETPIRDYIDRLKSRGYVQVTREEGENWIRESHELNMKFADAIIESAGIIRNGNVTIFYATGE